MAAKVLAAIGGHLNAIAFVLGFAVLYSGLAQQFSTALANIVTGCVVMGAAAWPFMAIRKR